MGQPTGPIRALFASRKFIVALSAWLTALAALLGVIAANLAVPGSVPPEMVAQAVTGFVVATVALATVLMATIAYEDGQRARAVGEQAKGEALAGATTDADALSRASL